MMISALLAQLVVHIRWPKYWSFRFSISPSNDYSGLIPFRIDWIDLLAVQGTFKSLLQLYNVTSKVNQFIHLLTPCLQASGPT